MKVGVKDMKDTIENDGPAATLLRAAFEHAGEDEKEAVLDKARDFAATHAMEQIIVTMAKAQRIVGEDEDPMAEVAMVIGRLGELCLINMMARMEDDVPDDVLETLLTHLNKVFTIVPNPESSLRAMFNDIRAQVKEQCGE
jgi:hypothetical protein